jgi:hypothetical protein
MKESSTIDATGYTIIRKRHDLPVLEVNIPPAITTDRIVSMCSLEDRER